MLQRVGWFALGLTLMVSVSSKAQSFGQDSELATARPAITSVRMNSSLPQTQSSSASLQDILSQRYQAEIKAEDKEEFFMPKDALAQMKQPTTDGSIRGTSTIQMVNKVNKKDPNEPEIFLFLDRFTIGRSLGGQSSCDIRFVVLSRLDKRLTSLDVKLVWPLMTTVLSFNNVVPNTLTYQDYTLVGDGCYSIDQIPNIVVNRCRVKGMSAAQCASKITWIKPINNQAQGRP